MNTTENKDVIWGAQVGWNEFMDGADVIAAFGWMEIFMTEKGVDRYIKDLTSKWVGTQYYAYKVAFPRDHKNTKRIL